MYSDLSILSNKIASQLIQLAVFYKLLYISSGVLLFYFFYLLINFFSLQNTITTGEWLLFLVLVFLKIWFCFCIFQLSRKLDDAVSTTIPLVFHFQEKLEIYLDQMVTKKKFSLSFK
jgi:hypothetical protein